MSALDKAKVLKEKENKKRESDLENSRRDAERREEERKAKYKFAKKIMKEFHNEGSLLFTEIKDKYDRKENDKLIIHSGNVDYPEVSVKVAVHCGRSRSYDEGPEEDYAMVCYFLTMKCQPENIMSSDADFEDRLANYMSKYL